MELAPGRSLSTFGLVMINVIAICNLRSLPFGAVFGWYLFPIYLLATLCFVFPVAMISSFFVSRFPERGGIYVWVREAIGIKLGFLAIWLQWVYNLFWYPTAMVFVVETILYGLGISVNKFDLVLLVTSMFWLMTFANCFGMQVSAFISILGAIIGTILPIILLISFAGLWLHSGKSFGVASSDFHSILPLVVNIIFGLMGLEMSCIHANSVKDPQRSYPRALFISSVFIVCLLSLATFSIAVVVPHETINLVNGANQALTIMLDYNHLGVLKPLVLTLIALGALSCIGTWIIGPSKGLYVAIIDGGALNFFAKTNKYDVPQRLLIAQAFLVTGLSLFYLYMPSLEQSYEMLSIATSQFALLAYMILIFAAISMRNTHVPGYEAPGGRAVYKFFCYLALAATLIVFVFGFQLPANIKFNEYEYKAILFLCFIILLIPVLMINRSKK